MDQILPEKLESYRIIEKLGSGPASETLKAFEPDSDREVVLKLVSPELSSRLSFRGPGLTLIRNVSSIAAESVCPVKKISKSENRSLLVRPFVEGSSFEMLVDSGPLDKESFLLHAEKLVEAVSQLHRQQLHHGNLRDSNIIQDNYGSIKLVDCGLMTGFSVDDLNPDQEAGEWLQFVPPELIRGQELGRHSDLYCLGVIFYKLVTGQLPFESGTNREVLERIKAGVIDKKALRNANLTGDCYLLIEKSLAREPQDRFSSAGELLVTLDEMSERSLIPDSPEAPVEAPAAPHVYILVSAAAILVAILWIILTATPR
ncbi:MAG: protein kinase [bacterium]|nr:protein kinase [bacterium]